MMKLDVDYVQRRSVRLNLAIMARTIPVVLSCRGAG
jgi:lipopolysaccharide/colanic/teichoic acid biosynthesis glycosyltransferase